jgi:hypothetical protein
MAKSRNHVVHSSDKEDLKRLKEEYEMLGRYCTLKNDSLIVHALDPRHGKKAKK